MPKSCNSETPSTTPTAECTPSSTTPCPKVNDKGRKKFATAEEAAIDAMQYANKKSVAENLEYGGWVYKNPDGTFSYDEPTKGQPAGLTNMPSKGPNDVAWYHTHGATDPNYDNENFSGADGDKGFSKQENADGYLATPTGVIKKYDVANDKESVLPQTAPP